MCHSTAYNVVRLQESSHNQLLCGFGLVPEDIVVLAGLDDNLANGQGVSLFTLFVEPREQVLLVVLEEGGSPWTQGFACWLGVFELYLLFFPPSNLTWLQVKFTADSPEGHPLSLLIINKLKDVTITETTEGNIRKEQFNRDQASKEKSRNQAKENANFDMAKSLFGGGGGVPSDDEEEEEE